MLCEMNGRNSSVSKRASVVTFVKTKFKNRFLKWQDIFELLRNS
jgi:hypothetical protein